MHEVEPIILYANDKIFTHPIGGYSEVQFFKERLYVITEHT